VIEERGIGGRRRKGPCQRLGLSLLVAAALAFGAPATVAWAHRQGTAQAASPDGISIPNLSHGQMAVIADNKAAILDLAARQTPTDPTMRRLETFINLQFFACAWGIVPGSLEDEASPFNECTHAYLAATRALLMHLQTMPGDRAPVRALVGKIELEMLSNRASLVLCRYSDEPFNTADVIGPHWSDIPFHPASLMSFTSLAMTILIGAWALTRRRPRSAGAG
jgi:hypothetical protein